MNNTETLKKVKASPVGQSLSGRYKLFVIDSDDKVVWETEDWQKNLILNQGMEALAPGSLPSNAVCYADACAIASMGDGGRYNKIEVGYQAGEGSGSVAGNTFTFVPGVSGVLSLTGSGGNGYSSVVSSGDMLQFQDGSEVRVTAVSNVTASVTPSATISIQPFTIYKTSQIGLQNAIHYVGGFNWFTNAGYCQTTTVGNTVRMKRSWDFAYETSSVTVREVGVGWATNANNYNFSTGPAYVFSRILLNTTTSLSSGQKLRLIYELDVSIYPNVTSSLIPGVGYGLPFTASIGGSNPWPIAPASSSAGYYNVQYYDLSYIATDGSSQNTNGYLEPHPNVLIFWSVSPALLAASGQYNSRAVNPYQMATAVPDPYSSMTWQCTKTGTFDTSQGSTLIRSFGIIRAGYSDPWSYQSFVCLFGDNQTKTNVQTLSLSFLYTWGRVLG